LVEEDDEMKSPYIFLVALVALFVYVGCSVEGTPSGGDDAVGAVQSTLTSTIPSGTFDVIGGVTLTCASPGGCDGQTSVTATTVAGDTEILFPGMNLGSYVLTVDGAPLDTLIPAIYGPASMMMPSTPPAMGPYCVYHGTRAQLVGCSFTSYTPYPIPVLANATQTVTVVFTLHFSDGVEVPLFTQGTVRVILQGMGETVCGESTDPCGAGELCATVDDTTPTNAEMSCWPVCMVDDPSGSAPPDGPWPAASPCPYTCVHVAGMSGTGAAGRGICVPPMIP
jgi:hypothetical protein